MTGRSGHFHRILTLGAVAGMLAINVVRMVHAHDVTTRVTWNREISRIVYARCAACHRPGGSAFSLLAYQEAMPWANAIKDSVLERTMPPWGAVKGFGSFRNEQALSQAEMELVEHWANGGAPEGNPNDLPPGPRIAVQPQADRLREVLTIGDGYRFDRPLLLGGFRVATTAEIASAQVRIAFPDGRQVPLVWLHRYSTSMTHSFLLTTPLSIPAGGEARGIPPGVVLYLLSSAATPAGR